MWSVLGAVRCALERSVYPASLGWKALYIWRKCPVVQCIIEGLGSLVDFMSGGPMRWWESGVKAPSSDCVSVHFSGYSCSSCLLHCGNPVLGAYRFPIPISSPWIDPWPLRNDLLCVWLIVFSLSFFYCLFCLMGVFLLRLSFNSHARGIFSCILSLSIWICP